MREWSPNGCGAASRVADPVLAGGDGDFYVVVPADHHRWRVSVVPDATVSAGDVGVRPRVQRGDDAQDYVDGIAATIAYDSDGGQAEGQWAPGPGRSIRLAVSGYVGAGNLVIQVETWRDPPWP